MSKHQGFARRAFNRIIDANMQKAERYLREHRDILEGGRLGR